jgi:hypothetical protein
MVTQLDRRLPADGDTFDGAGYGGMSVQRRLRDIGAVRAGERVRDGRRARKFAEMSRPRIAPCSAPWDRNGVTTFRERYCAARGLRRDQFQADVFQRCLEPPARAVAPVIAWLWPNQFSVDRDFILRVACSRTLREVNEEIHDFRQDPRNRHGGRGWAGPRISAERLQRLARAHLPTMAASRPAVGLAGRCGSAGDQLARLLPLDNRRPGTRRAGEDEYI